MKTRVNYKKFEIYYQSALRLLVFILNSFQCYIDIICGSDVD